ncbi:hypothetical protein [Halorarum halobium]|uniref:hypothetical protein n=1 Tax=Halorarum halobium TaxID=3075121 RepID=UPI0028B1172E|nr:hypothetical protein [Halobaculum sp. XH14]
MGATPRRQCYTPIRPYEYATAQHVCWLILAETGMRMGAARALDVEDYQPDADTPHLRIRHRPDTDTPIKNGQSGERKVAISPEATDVVDDYLETADRT